MRSIMKGVWASTLILFVLLPLNHPFHLNQDYAVRADSPAIEIEFPQEILSGRISLFRPGSGQVEIDHRCWWVFLRQGVGRRSPDRGDVPVGVEVGRPVETIRAASPTPNLFGLSVRQLKFPLALNLELLFLACSFTRSLT